MKFLMDISKNIYLVKNIIIFIKYKFKMLYIIVIFINELMNFLFSL